MSAPVTRMTVRLGERLITVQGRVAWALNELALAGGRGVTPLEAPGPRWSDYVFKLRRQGLNVETIHEGHGGPYSGHHARYVLRSPITIMQVGEAPSASA